MADAHDALVMIIAGLAGKPFTDDMRFTRPGTPAVAEPTLVAPTIAEFSVSGFYRQLYS